MLFQIANKFDYLVMAVMAVIVIIGIYQFYFWCQRNNFRKPIGLKSVIDDWFALKPAWIWVYSGIYYPIIIFMIFSFHDMRHFNYTVFSFFTLLMCQMLFFVFLPVQTPMEWRTAVTGNTVTHRFMRYIQSLDQSNNCFPSMHMSVSNLTALHLQANYPDFGNYVFVFPVLIAISALYTKQHFFLDLIPGALLGWVVFRFYLMIY
ncbi:MAG: phosphatase PAP2 family protein [Bacteroidia bacterium]